LIGGFIVAGTQPEKLLIRALGPSLLTSGNLGDPAIELHDATGAVIASNDNWVDSPDLQAIIDSGIPPNNSSESALLLSLPANNSAYTVVVKGAPGETGIGLVEVYDLAPGADSKLANISTRGVIENGDNVMIGGFIVTGDTAQKVIVRALGPSLALSGALADPLLELHDSSGALVQTSDNWSDDQHGDVSATGIAPKNLKESAIVRTLSPGAYTAVVRGVNNSTGIGLVEVYALP
jgi:hypothetical protein